ncbi:MAG: 23S rRNA (adenine(2503)-C(2))-methyltransferase RlmN [Nitrospinae bacterium]|nr:23S rRNA (adenine(2503)-C(2))-methyltransferase RlmN [Nitrospinota bacterium]
MTVNLKDLTFARQDELIAALGEPKFRAKQVRDWLYAKNCRDITLMTNLSKPLREKLAVEHTAEGLKTLHRRAAADGTIKYLFGLADGLSVETVYIPEEKRKTVCVSTQVGCKFSCAFCATGSQGFTRNLSLGEILNQVIEARVDAGDVTNVVFMGMGEPLDNYQAVVEAARMLNAKEGFNIGGRRITISTAGLAPQIEKLAGEGLNVNIAVSLHAADNAIRTRLMPINKKFPVEKLMDALTHYPLKEGRRITMEVILFDGVNDSAQDAKKLVRALHGLRAKVNLIRFNPVAGAELQPSPRERVEQFRQSLENSGLDATIRISRGGDIEAACGQLKSAKMG